MASAELVKWYQHKLFINVDDLLNAQILSKILSSSIIIVSLIVKLPQIIKILKNQSAKSISFLTILANLYSISIKGSYCFVQSFSLSAYGELYVTGFQTVILAALILHFNVSSNTVYFFILTYSAVIYVLASGMTPINVLWTMQGLSIPINFVGRMLQAYTIYKEKETGQLSGATCVMQVYIAASRIFTSIHETKDAMLIFTYTISTLSLTLILILYCYYSINGHTLSKSKIN